MITKEEVERIAKLARLELTEKETEKMQKDLSDILDYFDLLKKAPKSEKASSQKPGICTRKDEVVAQSREVAEKLVAASPDKEDSYIKVKSIL
ncbi:MAG: Asp-tRNA(Asn)/Glu-tRNA(Gln) amidotransferase subunit GatC [Candidatus Staskawiczbacteria bacterium]|nr:Asp-tRNA(Asn)/Glu-tRNA(Gln) amidotransferase subunit GatC [Candidatus Staskawiczbacteria bacterium]